jgi:predicted Fe-Mo cluster-binding NifX family protein
MSEERLIVVAAEDPRGFDGEVSAQVGHSPFFLLAEASGNMVSVSEVVPDPYLDAQLPDAVPRFIRDLGAKVIIAGGMGQGTREIFRGLGVEVAPGATGTVGTALGAYLSRERHDEVARARNSPVSAGGCAPRSEDGDG